MNQAAGNRALGYARVSTDEQREKGYSLPEQEAKIRAYCDRGGLELVEIVSDDFTGQLLERPGLSQVTRLAEAGAGQVGLGRLDRGLDHLGGGVHFADPDEPRVRVDPDHHRVLGSVGDVSHRIVPTEDDRLDVGDSHYSLPCSEFQVWDETR